MPRAWSVRVARAFVALWFVLSVGEPSVVHFCPMHGGILGELRGASPMADMVMEGSAARHRTTRSQRAETGDARHGEDHQAQHHHCTCINCCVGADAAALPSVHVELAPATWTLAAAPAASAETLPRPAPPHAQPPGTGPPRA